MNIQAIVTLVQGLAPMIGKNGLQALEAVDAVLKQGETLPAPLDKLSPFAKEAEFVVELFIAVDKMVFPSAS